MVNMIYNEFEKNTVSNRERIDHAPKIDYKRNENYIYRDKKQELHSQINWKQSFKS